MIDPAGGEMLAEAILAGDCEALTDLNFSCNWLGKCKTLFNLAPDFGSRVLARRFQSSDNGTLDERAGRLVGGPGLGVCEVLRSVVLLFGLWIIIRR